MNEFTLSQELKNYVPMILDQAQNGIVITDPTQEDNPLIYANENFLNTFEYRVEDIRGKNLRFLQGEDRKQPERDKIREAIKNKKAIQVLIRNYTKYGKIVYVDLTISPILDENDNIRFFVGIQKDKTNEYFLSQQVQQKSLSNLLTNIAHQWRQPLSLVSVSASSLLLKSELEQLSKKELQEKLQTVVSTIDNLSSTIETFTNLHNDKDKIIKTSMQKEFDKVIAMVKDTLKYHGIDLKLDKQCNDEKIFTINSVHFIESLLAIIQNAQEALVENKIPNPWIKITFKSKNEMILIRIEDNAKGIDPNNIKHVFEPYFTTKHKYFGVGMGLNLTYRIITEELGGKIDVQNSSNGAVFTIEIPQN